MTSGFQFGRRLAFCAFLLAWPASVHAVDVVVGTGTPASCTEGALNSAVSAVNTSGGTIRFNCGGAATINITTQKVLSFSPNPNLTYTIDGGGLITLNGQGITRHIWHRTGTLNVLNITFTGGHARGDSDDASGGAIRSDRLTGTMGFNLANVTFVNNVTELTSWSAPFSPFDYGGAAVFTRFGNVTITNCYFANNTAINSSGGALHGRSSAVSIIGSVFTSNTSTGGGFGGGVYFDGLSPNGANGTLQIVNSHVTGNTAWGMGGGIFWFLYPEKNESVSINAVNVIGNAVVDSGVIPFVGNRGFGGGLVGDTGNVLIQNSTFANNTVRGQVSTSGGGAGGGIWLTNSSSAVILNTTVSGNRAIGNNADAAGGGVLIYNNTQPFQIIHSTIVNNQAGWVGGGIHSPSSGILTNTVVANNTATAFSTMQQCSAQFSNGGGALQYPDIQGAPGSGNPYCANSVTVANPLLGALASNGGFTQTHLPQPGSPLLDAVSCAASTDQRGVARPQGARCDIGSVEFACGVTLNPLTLTTGRQGVAYSQTFSSGGGVSPVTFSEGGTLPAGLSFNAGNATLSGTPTQSGSFPITVSARDAYSCVASRPYNLVIAGTTAVNPAALAVDAAGNGVLEANQAVVVDPRWTNQTGGAVSLTGTLSSFLGPAGATYTINDGSASYGSVNPGGTAACSTASGNCYSLSIAAAARPAAHWDASVVESLSTGGPKAWALHVGGSFTDVPVSSGFYRFIEILLHRGITGGCSATAYCPSNATTRDQMAVFVLVAKEGAGYTPPACSPPNIFADVPETSGFCRWIEELSRRAVVSGCGGGNYCPTSPVTREQMAIFVLRTLDPALSPPACGTPVFNDVPASSATCRWIEELARRGVVSGCGNGNYCPTSPVTREQMGVFLSATFGLTLYGP